MDDGNADFQRLLHLLDRAMAQALALHAPHRDFGTGVPLYRTETHTIQAIGERPEINVTDLAEHMGVTKGAVSQTIGKLVEKGLVRRIRPAGNAKEVRLGLTDLGSQVFGAHERFHQQMLETVRAYFGADFRPKLRLFIEVMADLNGILAEFARRSGHP